MHRIGLGRGDKLSSLIIIRNRPETDPASKISSFALFNVVSRGRQEAQFDLMHHCFDPDEPQDSIILEVRKNIPKTSQLIVRQPMIPRKTLREIANGKGSLPLLDNQKLARALPAVTLLPLHVSDAQLIASAEALGLDMPRQDSLRLERHRRASVEAIALWGIYIRAFGPKTDATSHCAAFQAWHLLQRLRTEPPS